MQEVSIDPLQQQVHTFRGKVREVCGFLRGEHPPPHADHLYMYPPWGLSVPVPIFLVLRFFLILRLRPAPCDLVALLCLFPPSVAQGGGGVYGLVSPFPPLFH